VQYIILNETHSHKTTVKTIKDFACKGKELIIENIHTLNTFSAIIYFIVTRYT